MLRRTHILVTLAAAAMLSGCPDSAPPMMTTDAVDSRVPDGAEDTLTDGPGELPDDTLPPDGLDGLDSGEETHDQADGTSDGDAPPPPPELTFCLVTPVAGCVGADQEIIELVKNAETSDDLYPATPALEVDVQVTTGNLPEGTEISLVVDGSVVASQFLPADGTLDFAMVQLTHAVEPDCHVVEVAAGDLASVSRTVCVDTGACGITLEPANLECLHEDENPELAGFQATFTVTSGGTDCDQAWIAALEESTEPVTLDGGQAVIEVTLAPMVAGLDCHAVELAASVGSSGDPSRTATLERAYVLDTVSPVLTIVEPTAQTVNLGDDLDGDPDNGIQILLEGTATGLAPDDLVAVILDGDEVAVVPADGGTFLLEELTLDGDGLHTIEVHAVEACCGEAASDAIGVVALLSPSNVMLLSPLEGSVVLAQEDMDLQTPLILEDGFLVYAPLAEAGEFLQIQCRRNKAGSIWGVAGSLAVPAVEQNGIYTVSVALDVAFLGTEVICRARDGASPPFFSPEVAFSVALPAPILTLVAPVTGDLLVPASFAAVASASNLAGRTATLTLLKDNVEAWSEALPITPTGFFLAEDLSSLEDGVYTLAVQASDAWGNEAGDHPSSVVEAVFELDGTPPGLSLLYPQQGMSCNATTCPDASSVIPGHQFPFQALVSGEPHPDLTEVCFALNGDTPVCLAANAITGQAVLDTLTVISGDNSVVVTATDGAGHSVSLSAVSFTFVADMPRIKMPSPPGNVVIASLPLAITVLVASPDGVTSLEDAEVSLLVDGAVVETLNAGPGGVYGFSLDGLTVGVPVVIQARVTHASTTDPGYSGTRTILLKEGIPAITLTAPADGEILSLASAECSGSTGCTLTIAAETTNAEDKSPATLDVDCGGPAVQETGEVQGGQVFFPGVTLPEGATCTLTASVTDLAGQEAASAPVTVTVDRIAPVLGAFVLPVFELLPAALDEDPGTPGYQYTVIVSAGGLEAGRAVQLSIAPEVGAAEVIETVLAGPIPDGQTAQVTLPQYTFDEGVYVLTAQVEDLAGNTAVLAMSVRVFLEATQVSLLGSDFSSFATCMDDAGCGDQAICEPVGGTGRCVHPWDGGTQKINVGSQPADYFSSLEAPLRLCSSHAGLLAAGAPLCGTTIGSEKFREIKSVPHGGGAAVVTFTPAQLAALPSGYHHVVAEALADDGTWIRSVDTPNFTQQNRHYWLDVMPPSVTGVSFPTDTQAPIGTLGLAERTGAPAIFPVQVTLAAAETGILEVWGNGLLLATEPLAGSTVTLDLALVQGVNLLQVLAFDKVGNGSAPFGLSVTVDTVPPVMTFVQPVGSPQVAGSSPDVILLASAVDGNDLSLERFTDGAWGLLGTAAPGMTGLTTFSGALAQDGTWVLRGRAQDDAGNETSIFTVPGTIVVDRTPPTGSLTAPAAAASLEDDDDAAPAAPGFQIQVAFDLADAATWEVRLAECPDATFTGCGTAVLKASGSLPGPAPATVDTTVTLGAVDQPVEHRQLRVKIADGVGNALQLAANLTITLTACQVDFADFPDTGWYNTTSCAVPGQGCASITPVLTAVFTAGCGTVDAVRLYHDAAVQATLPVLAGSQVAFPLSLSHGTMATFEARLVAAGVETGDTSGERDVQVDLTLPAVAFADPPAGTVVLAMADDQNPSLAGCQVSPVVDVTGDNLAGGALVLSTAAGGPVTILGGLAMTASPFQGAWVAPVTLAEAASRILTAEATDLAGNTGTAALTLNVDVTPPAPPAFAAVDPGADVNPRRPAVTLRWTAPGDDGSSGGAADTYDLRYDIVPVTEASFDEACDLGSLPDTAALPAPAAPGVEEVLTVTGPDDRAPSDPCRFVLGTEPDAELYFALRALDEAGNASALTTASSVSTDAARLRFTALNRGTYNDGNLDGTPVPAGDVNGDGLADVLLGAYGLNGFCLMLGREEPPDSLTLSQDPLTQCLLDSNQSQVGLDLAGLGDVNGDGYGDVATVSYRDADGTARTRVRIYLGSATGTLPATPGLSFVFGTTGLFWTNFVYVAGAGNFDGDLNAGKPVHDILVGTPQANVAYVVPGSVAWGTAPLTINLESATDRALHRVVDIRRVGGAAFDWFGMSVAGVGNVLADGGGAGTQYDDVLVSQYSGSSAAWVIRGRPLPASSSLTVSAAMAGAGNADASSVRLIPEPTLEGEAWFMGQAAGGEDLDGDGIPEIVGVHMQAALFNARSLYVFRGSAVAAAVGTTLQIAAGPKYGSAWMNTKGTVIGGNFFNLALAGNFDDATDAPELSSDLVYGDFNGLSFFGSVYVRFNLPGQLGLASFQELDLAISDPQDPGNPDFGGPRIAAVGDFTGDGFPDLVVGTAGSGYSVLIH